MGKASDLRKPILGWIAGHLKEVAWGVVCMIALSFLAPYIYRYIKRADLVLSDIECRIIDKASHTWECGIRVDNPNDTAVNERRYQISSTVKNHHFPNCLVRPVGGIELFPEQEDEFSCEYIISIEAKTDRRLNLEVSAGSKEPDFVLKEVKL